MIKPVDYLKTAIAIIVLFALVFFTQPSGDGPSGGGLAAMYILVPLGIITIIILGLASLFTNTSKQEEQTINDKTQKTNKKIFVNILTIFILVIFYAATFLYFLPSL